MTENDASSPFSKKVLQFKSIRVICFFYHGIFPLLIEQQINVIFSLQTNIPTILYFILYKGTEVNITRHR